MKHFLSDEKKVLPDNLLRQKTNCDLTYLECWNIRSILKYSLDNPDPKLKLSDKIDLNSEMTIQKFLMNKDLKSKDFRIFFLPKQTEIKKITTTINRYNWAGINPIDSVREIMFHKVWQYQFLPIELRHFSLKFVNNYYKLNVHLHGRDNTVSADCSFCTTNYVALGAEREKIDHFFGKCNVTQNFATNYFNEFLQHVNFNFSIDWLLLGAPSTIAFDLLFIINIEIMFLNYFMYNCRFKKTKPKINDFINFMSWNRNVIRKNHGYNVKFAKLKFPFDRG